MLLSILCLILGFMSMVNISSACQQHHDDGKNTCEKCPNCCQGPPGIAGPPGERGEVGPLAHTQKSAFTVTKSVTQGGQAGTIVTFDQIITNINNDFDVATNKFTCAFKGTYIFSFSIGKYSTGDVFVNLMHSGNPIVSAHSRSNWVSNFDLNSNTAVLNLAVGDQVWLEFYHATTTRNAFGSELHKTTTFSGYLLYED